MKKIILSFLILPFFIKSQIPNFNFALATGNAGGVVFGNSIARDASGNIYAAGSFAGVTDFDPSPTVSNLTPVGFYDIYLVKYNSAGQLQWAFNIGSAGDEGAYSVVTDASGNIYISGYVQGVCDFDPSVTTTTLNCAGGYDSFVAKYNSNGQYIWGFTTGGTGDEWATASMIDAGGNICLTGLFQNTVDFDPAAGVSNVNSTGAFDIYVAKYNSSGIYQWAFGVGDAAGNESGTAICKDPSGNICVTGYMQGTCDFDPSPSIANLTGIGPQDIFIAKYNGSGQYLWANNMGSPGNINNTGNKVRSDASGNFYLTGKITGTVDLDPSPAISTFSTTGSGDQDIFLAKYNASGQYVWGFNLGSTGFEEADGLAIDASNNVYVGGIFSGTVDLNPGPGINNFNANLGNDAFVAKFNSAGVYDWAFNLGSTNTGVVTGIEIDAGGNVFTTGYFTGTADFDPSLAVFNITSQTGTADLFVAKYSSLCTPLSFTFNVNKPSCPNNNDGTATITASGGASPYTYDWGVAAGNQTTQVAVNLFPNVYSVLVLDNNNCPFNANLVLSAASIPIPSICMVTVDSIGQNNLILWDQNQYAGADSFFVYRDIANNNYQIVGKVAKTNPFGEFRDTTRTLYPANGDPRVASWKYKIAIKDTCGNLSVKGPFHKSLFIQNSSGNFSWNDYQVEGQPVPVPALNNYVFRRDNTATGNWQNIQTLSAASIAYTDPNYGTYQSTADWRIETLWNVQCTSSYLKSPLGTVKKSKSNVSNNRPAIGLKKNFFESFISVYPNPAKDLLNIDVKTLNENYDIVIENTLGQIVYESKSNKNNTMINVSKFSKGFYNLKITIDGSGFNKKLIIE